ncbi:hypothetical protein SAMN06296241_0252 [Salinimicrobium sediminis]|uniref:DUF5666 domain-containing protein n=1 Tax=Salinimicrobium sediminis TaxID=1343891 RepID=A0A285X074_9FLAO|nr:hypothetical protein [Salinimicrobium sediminis]SOC78737.1 hypothetical protein SAMN06296241_0252 [Salinimicrobium sediminis]
MKRSIMILAVSSMIFSTAISCKNAEENNSETIEMTGEATMNEMDDSMSEVDTTMSSDKELEDTDLVESGTYTGTALVVDAEQNEVYVQLNDTTTIELYFSNETQIMRDGQTVAFDALQKGQKIEVEVERSGESLKPLKVSIMGNS